MRRTFLASLAEEPPASVGFYEVAPENWIGIGGWLGRLFRQLAERHPFVCHGLSLSIGSPSPLDETFLAELKAFFDEFDIKVYSEHLSYCSDDGHLYDLLPIPFTDEAVGYVAGRIKRVQEILERRIAIENVSYYAAPGKEMDEITFLNAVLDEADCDLLLDVNNIYVNSINHGYDAEAYLKAIPAERIAYAHIAGHYVEAEEFLEFLENEREGDCDDPPFLLELAHYEWVEMALAIAEGQAPGEDKLLGADPLSQTITVSEIAWPLAYRYPVHKIAPEFQPQVAPAEPTYLVVYRNNEDQVQFLEITAVTFRLLQLLQENDTATAREILVRIATEMQHPNPEVVLAGGAESLISLAGRGVIKRV